MNYETFLPDYDNSILGIPNSTLDTWSIIVKTIIEENDQNGKG